MDKNKIFLKSESKIITPETPLVLAGYNNRDKPFEKIASDLEANSFCLKDAFCQINFTSLDCLYIDNNLINLPGKLSKNEGLTQLNFAGATHTHFAPSLDRTKPTLAKTDDTFYKKIQLVIQNLSETPFELNEELSSIEYFSSKVSLSINRRRKNILFLRNLLKLKTQVVNAPNSWGETDNEIRLIVFKNNMNQVKSILWSFACHPTAWPCINEVSSEYIGVVRKKLRAYFGEVPVLFFQGFSGNISAKKKRPSSLIGIIRNILHLQIKPVPFTKDEFYDWADSLGNAALSAIRRNKPQIFTPSLSFKKFIIPLQKIIDGKIPDLENLEITTINICSELKLIGFSAEPVVEYIKILKQLFPNNILIPIGCLAGTFGYLPTDKIIKEEGYEGKGFFKIFGYNCSFKEGIEETIIKTLKETS